MTNFTYYQLRSELDNFINFFRVKVKILYKVDLDFNINYQGHLYIPVEYVNTSFAGYDPDSNTLFLNLPVIEKLNSIEEFRYLLIHEVSHFINLKVFGMDKKTKENNYGHNKKFNEIELKLCDACPLDIEKIDYDILGFSERLDLNRHRCKIIGAKEFDKMFPNYKMNPDHVFWD